MKNENTIFYIIGVVILVAFLLSSQVPKATGVGITVHFIKDGKEVYPQKGLFTIVNPPNVDADYVYFEISGVNGGATPISNIQVVAGWPIEFEDSLSGMLPQTLEIGENKLLWTSEWINATLLEAYPQPITFWVDVSGVDDYTGETIYTPRAYSEAISFTSEILEWGYEMSYPIVLSSTGGIFWDGVKWTVAGVGGYIVPEFVVEEYDSSWNYIQSYAPGTVGCTSGIHKKDGQWFISDICDGRIYEFNSDWSYTGRSIYLGGWMEGIFWDGANWYVLDEYEDVVAKFNSDWSYTGQYYYIGSEEGGAKDIYWDGANWWMLGASTKTVYKYDSSWSYTGESYPIEFGFKGMFNKDLNWFTVGNKEVYQYLALECFKECSVGFTVPCEVACP